MRLPYIHVYFSHEVDKKGKAIGKSCEITLRRASTIPVCQSQPFLLILLKIARQKILSVVKIIITIVIIIVNLLSIVVVITETILCLGLGVVSTQTTSHYLPGASSVAGITQRKKELPKLARKIPLNGGEEQITSEKQKQPP